MLGIIWFAGTIALCCIMFFMEGMGELGFNDSEWGIFGYVFIAGAWPLILFALVVAAPFALLFVVFHFAGKRFKKPSKEPYGRVIDEE